MRRSPRALDLCAIGALAALAVAALEFEPHARLLAFDPSVRRLLAIHLLYGALLGLLCHWIARGAARARGGTGDGGAVLPLSLLGTALGLLPALEAAGDLEPLPRIAALAAVLALGAVLGSSVALAARLPPLRDRPWRALRLAALAAAFLVGLPVLLDRVRPGPAPEPSAPHVVLISLDTLRRDHLGLYGYPAPTSPRLDAFARDAVVFENALAPEPWTLPSHMSMLTGLHPVAHGVLRRDTRLNPDHATLAERLSQHGYDCAAFVTNRPDSWIGRDRGFADGFALYEHPPHAVRRAFGTSLGRALSRPPLGPAPGSAEDIRLAAADYLARRDADRPLFLFLHVYDIHSDEDRTPYEAPAEHLALFRSETPPDFDGCDNEGRCATRYLAHQRRKDVPEEVLSDIVAHYDAGIRATDAQIGRLLRTLQERGYYEDAVIVVTADHGEAFLEHDRFLHEQLYGEVLDVPLVVKLPRGRNAGARIRRRVTTLDLTPTLLDLAGVPAAGPLHGHSLRPLLDGSEDPPRPVFVSNTLQYGDFRTFEVGVVSEGHKLIVPVDDRGALMNDPAAMELYDLAGDPEETRDLADGTLPPVGRALAEQARAWYEARLSQRDANPPASISMDATTEEQLRALGYLE